MYATLIPAFLALATANQAFATPAETCNERIRQEILRSSAEKCGGSAHDLFWSEKEIDISADRKTIAGGFAFTCKTGNRYLGLIKSTFGENCVVDRAVISHTSTVPASPISQENP